MRRTHFSEYDRQMIFHTGETDAQREARLIGQMGRPVLAPLLAWLSVRLTRAAARCHAAAEALKARETA